MEPNADVHLYCGGEPGVGLCGRYQVWVVRQDTPEARDVTCQDCLDEQARRNQENTER